MTRCLSRVSLERAASSMLLSAVGLCWHTWINCFCTLEYSCEIVLYGDCLVYFLPQQIDNILKTVLHSVTDN